MTGLLTLKDLVKSEMLSLIDTAKHLADRLERGERHSQLLAGNVVTNAFFEPSTRTRLSFEQSARFLGADVLTFNPGTASTVKGESLGDTAKTLAAIGTDVFVVRHTLEDGPRVVAEATGLPVVNGGAGRAEHPTQTLLDALTLTRRFGSIQGLSMGIVGDIANSRVANGHLIALPDLGVHITLIGPPTLIPESVPPGMAVTDDFDAALPGLDVIYMLRIQKERGANIGFDSEAAYVASFGLDDRRLGLAPKTTVVMHPGPINRGLEITGSVADGTRSLIETQVAMGVPMRMAILAACLGVTP